jgi:hypothetical protein
MTNDGIMTLLIPSLGHRLIIKSRLEALFSEDLPIVFMDGIQVVVSRPSINNAYKIISYFVAVCLIPPTTIRCWQLRRLLPLIFYAQCNAYLCQS